MLVGLFIAGSVLRPSEVSNAAARSALSDSEVIQSAETLAAAPDTDGMDTEYGNNGYNATYMTVPGYFIYGHQMPDPVAEEDFYVTPLIQSFGGYADNTGTETQGGLYYIGTDKYGSYQDIIQRYDFGSDTRTTTIINNYGNSEYNQFPNMTYEYYFKEYINYINIQRGSRYLPTLYIKFYDYSAVSSGSENSHYSIDITLYDFIETDTPVTGEELYNALLSQVRSQYNVITGITWRDIYIYSSNLLTPGEYVLNGSNYSDWITDAVSDAYHNGFNAGVASGTAPSKGFLDSVLTALNSLFTNFTNLLGTEIAPGLNIGLFVIGIPASFMILDLIISLILKFLGRGGSSSS